MSQHRERDPRIIDLSGQRFSRWTVIALGSKQRNTMWICQCECGTTREVASQHLRCGKTHSCGCYKVERTIERSTKHGHKTRARHTPEYEAWCNAKRRCYDTTHPRYADWGGRGITMCPEWVDDFAAFLRDMGPRPKGRTIDRVDNNGPYAPENCRWATPSQQNRNRRPVTNGWIKRRKRAA